MSVKFTYCIIFTAAVLATLSVTPVSAKDGFRVPDCATLEKWSSVLPLAANLKEKHDPEFVERHEAAIRQLLSDESMLPVFGVVNGRWDNTRRKPLSDAIYHCTQTLIKSGKRDAAQKLTEARYYAGQVRGEPRSKGYHIKK